MTLRHWASTCRVRGAVTYKYMATRWREVVITGVYTAMLRMYEVDGSPLPCSSGCSVECLAGDGLREVEEGREEGSLEGKKKGT